MSAFIAALVSGALAYNATETVKTTEFTTYCPEPTVFTYQNSTYTVTEATTLTITDCGCEESQSKTVAPVASAKNTSAPAVTNGVAAGKVGAVAGAAAVAALLL